MAGRPKIPRKTCCVAKCSCFKPNKASQKKFDIHLFPDEIEVLDLCDKQNLKQKDAALKMKISQPTLARILSSARGKLAQAVINGGEINIG
jgi:predicted DNA-binding protein (UPF0251 family)